MVPFRYFEVAAGITALVLLGQLLESPGSQQYQQHHQRAVGIGAEDSMRDSRAGRTSRSTKSGPEIGCVCGRVRKFPSMVSSWKVVCTPKTGAKMS